MRITNCEIKGANEACIRDLNTAAAAEVVISNSRLTARAELSGTGVGIDMAGSDNMVMDNIIYECANGAVRFRGAGNELRGNHIYKGETNSATIGVLCENCTDITILNNYIDNVHIRIEDAGNFENTIINSNKFLKTAASSITTFIEFAPQAANRGVLNIAVVGNMFHSFSGTPASVTEDTTDGTISTTEVYKVTIAENTFSSVGERFSHPRDSISLSSATSGNVNLGSRIPFGSIKHLLSSTFARFGGSGTTHYLTRSGNTVTANVDASSSGTIVVQGTINGAPFH